ncbi:MAG: hypothetical protein JNK00_10570 [Flavipsychrobacter sp.]|nr:hypothetical protein [Flavipsychrobacter sp.]
MRYLQAFCLSAAIALASVTNVAAQGESDPGFTNIGAMRWGAAAIITEDEYEFQRAHFSVGHTFSQGERDVKYHIPQLEVRLPIMETGYFDVRFPILSASGDLGNKWGAGDLTAAYTHVFKADPETWTLQATGGLMFGMTTANSGDVNRPLPMAYQSGLGSTDAIVGFNATWKEYLSISAGYQQPVFRYNENEYFRSSNINDPVYSNSEYIIGRKLYRNGDVMMRLEGRFATNRIGFSAGPLAMYHLRNDLYEDRTGLWHEIQDSKGFTLSGVGNIFVRFGRYGSFKLDVTGSLPFIKRDVRADGLDRQYTLMPRFTFFFNQRTLLF